MKKEGFKNWAEADAYSDEIKRVFNPKRLWIQGEKDYTLSVHWELKENEK